ncbi:MAG: hypothetical protein GQ557_02705 [Mycoplasmataceae bacterium]|nr:hypothetical protein [Mycoplasmataceae bacterium]
MSKIWKKDLGQEGSGNYGATNAFRAWGSKGFAIVFILDMMKSISAALVIWFLAILIGKIIISDETIIFLELTLAIPFAIVFVMIGHTYPLYFGFKGGKGVACSFGLIIVINWIFALIAISCFGVILKITKKMSAASIFGTLIGGILLLFQPLMYSTQAYVLVPGWSLMWSIWPGVFITVMIVEIKHIPNIKRMIRGEELSIGNENK